MLPSQHLDSMRGKYGKQNRLFHSTKYTSFKKKFPLPLQTQHTHDDCLFHSTTRPPSPEKRSPEKGNLQPTHLPQIFRKLCRNRFSSKLGRQINATPDNACTFNFQIVANFINRLRYCGMSTSVTDRTRVLFLPVSSAKTGLGGSLLRACAVHEHFPLPNTHHTNTTVRTDAKRFFLHAARATPKWKIGAEARPLPIHWRCTLTLYCSTAAS